jgi:glycerophosphoryl diester phosphodiesterase
MLDPFPRLLVLGHRGSPGVALENTLRSFDLALQDGADGVELDVQRAGDGTPVVIHDGTLDRTFGVPGRIAELAWPAIRQITGARLPSLEQATAWAAAAGAWVNVELKSSGVEGDTVRILEAHGLMERSFVSSFDAEVVARVGELAPAVRRFFLTESWNDDARDQLTRSGAAGLCLRVDSATPMTLEVLRREGLAVVVWTVDDPARITQLVAAGVAGIITNRPAAAVAAVRSAAERA